MRTNGELTKEEFIEQKNIVNQKISDLEKQISNTVENDTENILIDYDRIIEMLNEVMDFSKPKVDKDIIDKFVYKIVPMGNNHFCWYMNLDEKNSSAFNIGIEGSKKQAVISIDEEGTSSPVHNINSNDTQIVYINDKKSFTSAILHRLQSQRCNLAKPNNKGTPQGVPLLFAFILPDMLWRSGRRCCPRLLLLQFGTVFPCSRLRQTSPTS